MRGLIEGQAMSAEEPCIGRWAEYLGGGWLSTSVKSKCWFEGGVLVDSRGACR